MRKPAVMCPNTALIAIGVTHPANEITCRFRLHGHLIGQRPQGFDVDWLTLPFYGDDSSDWLCPPRDAHRSAGFGLLDQFPQMCLRLCDTDGFHPGAPDHLVAPVIDSAVFV